MNAVLLLDPKFGHNVGGAIRACAIFGVEALRWTGERVESPRLENGITVIKKHRFPREERMKTYSNVNWDLEQSKRPISDLSKKFGLTPIAVEIRDGAEELGDFIHPENALYVFGPEDGSLGRASLGACHRFLRIPSDGCLNLAAAVNVVLYDRNRQRRRDGEEPQGRDLAGDLTQQRVLLPGAR